MKKIIVASTNPAKIMPRLMGLCVCFPMKRLISKGFQSLPELVTSPQVMRRHINDIVFKKQNSKQTNGAVGILTDDAITRTTYYADAMVFALSV